MDLLGRLVEVWSGKPFDVFLRERIFEPLKMDDTAFYAPKNKHDRLATLYRLDEDGAMIVAEGNSSFREPPKLPMGGSGLVSTPRDFFRFVQMLANGGEFEGVRILSPLTVSLMTTDHLPSSMGAQPIDLWPESVFEPLVDSNAFDRGIGFGFTGSVLVNQAKANTIGLPGSFGWGGAAGTFFGINLEQETAVLFFTQLMVPPYNVDRRLQVLVSQALIE
jgi:CubicO group peptidase (beta-lactamase class C family)